MMSKKTAVSRLSKNRIDHLANERTFLAWIRTAVGIMAFGFVVVKFALFIKQFAYLFVKEGQELPSTHSSYSSGFGIFLVAFGSLLGLFSFFKYKSIEKQIEEDTYGYSSALATILTVLVVTMGFFLVVYLLST